jgi:DNA-binding HxlR family transcriptional regulator
VIALSELFLIHDTICLVTPKFAVEVLFALADGPLRYADLFRTITGASHEVVYPSTVIDSLRKLQDNGLLLHTTGDHDDATYRLTPMGRDLVTLLSQVGAWGEAHRDKLDR